MAVVPIPVWAHSAAPGVKQPLAVTIAEPVQKAWSFQETARPASTAGAMRATIHGVEQFALELDLFPQPRVFSVTELNAAIRGVLDSEFTDIRVTGEVSGVKLASDRKSTRLNSSHLGISYAVFC